MRCHTIALVALLSVSCKTPQPENSEAKIFAEVSKETYYNELVRLANKQGKTDVDHLFRALVLHYFDQDKTDDFFWNCADDMKNIFSAFNDYNWKVRTERQSGLVGIRFSRRVPGDSATNHFFVGAGAFAGSGKIQQRAVEYAQNRGAIFDAGKFGADAWADDAYAFLGDGFSSMIYWGSEARCRCMMKEFTKSERPVRLSDFLVSPMPLHEMGTDPSIPKTPAMYRKYRNAWVEVRRKQMKQRLEMQPKCDKL